MTEVRADQKRFLELLLEYKEPVDFKILVHKAGIEQAMAMGTVTYAQEENWIKVEEYTNDELIPSCDLEENLKEPLPERKFLEVLKEKPVIPMKEVVQHSKQLGIKMNEIIKWGKLRGWIDKQKGDMILTDAGKKALEEKDADEKALEVIVDTKEKEKLKVVFEKGERFTTNFYLEELKNYGVDIARVKNLLKNRADFVKFKPRNMRKIEATSKGKEIIPELKVKKEEINQLTREDIISGKWEEMNLRSYDVTLESQPIFPKKCHPMQKIIQETRKAFLQMGFEEIVSSHTELGFWDFDALFQPQDHPSRDMQDTFYLKRPATGKLPQAEIVERVKQTHENGGDTGSTGWGYKWDIEEAKRMVLRTHTTATTIHALAKNPNPPRKVFCVGRVFRNETISFKHLPEFHQVDGVVIDEHASFSCLLGTLREFYRNMGFEKVKFKPAFFPYTEPSAEVFVWMESKKCWIELGGSGIFRPEVTRPFNCNVPVMAWGLGLERLAMLRYGVNDIRKLYGSDLNWLQEVRLCQ